MTLAGLLARAARRVCAGALRALGGVWEHRIPRFRAGIVFCLVWAELPSMSTVFPEFVAVPIWNKFINLERGKLCKVTQ